MKKQIQSKEAFSIPGPLALLMLLGLGVAAARTFYLGVTSDNAAYVFGAVGLFFGIMLLSTGFVIVEPLEARVIQFFGNYSGTLSEPGLKLTLPLSVKRKISLRLRNFESPKLKVNEAEGNPIEIAAIVVWQVIDSAEAVFNVDDLEEFVQKQTESALRILATRYPYDKHDGYPIALHGNIDEVNEELKKHVIQSVRGVGVEIVEVRISHLAYAPEIAAAMLQRQQAQAIIAARQQIVEGAVGMVQSALAHLTQKGIVELDSERKAAMVSNLLVVLCSERPSQPVINAGSIY